MTVSQICRQSGSTEQAGSCTLRSFAGEDGDAFCERLRWLGVETPSEFQRIAAQSFAAFGNQFLELRQFVGRAPHRRFPSPGAPAENRDRAHSPAIRPGPPHREPSLPKPFGSVAAKFAADTRHLSPACARHESFPASGSSIVSASARWPRL